MKAVTNEEYYTKILRIETIFHTASSSKAGYDAE
jgi:hypothetical protein